MMLAVSLSGRGNARLIFDEASVGQGREKKGKEEEESWQGEEREGR